MPNFIAILQATGSETCAHGVNPYRQPLCGYFLQTFYKWIWYRRSLLLLSGANPGTFDIPARDIYLGLFPTRCYCI